MTDFVVHDLETAPEKSKTLLNSSIKNFGFIPNQSAVMAEAPTLLEAYQRAHELFIECSLAEEEKAIVWICAGMAHSCDYTVCAHQFIAKSNAVPMEYLTALKNNTPLPAKLEALRKFCRIVITCQGQINQSDINDFIQAGFNKAQVFEVILGVSQKTMSNIVNNIAGTLVDDMFKSNI